MQIAIQGDDLQSLKLTSDTSLFIATYLAAAGQRIFWYQPDTLTYLDSNFLVSGVYIECVYDDENHLQYNITSDYLEMNLSTFSCILIRQNPPVNMQYIASTHLLSLFQSQHPQIFFMNDPAVLRNEVEKLLPITISTAINQPTIIPPTLISSNYNQIINFLNLHSQIVLKPIYGYGGQDVITLSKKDNLQLIKEYLAIQQKMPIIAQKFLSEVYHGDKRVLVCDGAIIGTVGRKPAMNNFLTNTSAGGRICGATLSQNEEIICQKVAMELKKRNIFFAGIDLIGEYITEINITSPTLLMALSGQKKVIQGFIDKLLVKCLSNR